MIVGPPYDLLLAPKRVGESRPRARANKHTHKHSRDIDDNNENTNNNINNNITNTILVFVLVYVYYYNHLLLLVVVVVVAAYLCAPRAPPARCLWTGAASRGSDLMAPEPSVSGPNITHQKPQKWNSIGSRN